MPAGSTEGRFDGVPGDGGAGEGLSGGGPSGEGLSAEEPPAVQPSADEPPEEDPSGEPSEENGTDGSPSGLSEAELAILAFEKRWWRQPGAKEQAITGSLGMSVTRYYRSLGELLDKPEALAAEPAVVKRLQRARAERHRLR